ncbi:NAD(P)-binding protein [Arthrobacter sp. OY3WO11]|uniref:NAD(P)-binding protein n=1 Tax=Arthrobacter sp. OY3WO11 TaxID=1835723 RepID=UPI000A4716E4|nr:NAD(P)-binding protein [Arthrobacter sp. OY3WO11]
MKAIVVGAGIAGLVAARQLGSAGWDVELVEKSPGPRPDGYMMDFFGPGLQAAERIGLYPRLAAVTYQVEAVDYVDGKGRRTCSLDYNQFARLAGGKILSLLRPDMERAALAALDDVAPGRVRISYGAQVSRVWSDHDGVRVTVEACRRPPSPRTSWWAPMASTQRCGRSSSAPKTGTCAPWACVRPRSP